MELLLLLGLCDAFLHFVLNFACVVVSLNKKLRKGQLPSFEGISDDEITVFETLKARLM